MSSPEQAGRQLEAAEAEADKYRKAADQQARRAEAAEAEVRRLNGYIDQYILDVERLTEIIRAQRS